MKKRYVLLAGLAVGFVLGSRSCLLYTSDAADDIALV